MIRLDKFICSAGSYSRKEAKKLIKDGKVRADGSVCRNADMKIDENKAVVEINGRAVSYSRFSYIIMNKPSGAVCSNDEKGERTVFDILPPELMRKGLFTAGRLDKDTVGLLIITDDGDFSHRLMSPKKHVEKVYYAEGKGKLLKNAEEMFKEGMLLGDERLKSARLNVLYNDGETIKAEITVSEGKYHQVKRMLYKAGIETTYLKRIKIGGLSLDENLKEGDARIMTADEMRLIF